MNVSQINRSPRLIVIHGKSSPAGRDAGGLRLLTSHEPFASATLDYLAGADSDIRRLNILVVPGQWRGDSEQHDRVVRYTTRIPLSRAIMSELRTSEWLIVSNGRFVSTVSRERLVKILANLDADVIAINVDPALAFYGETVSRTSEGKVAGFRRFYRDSAVPTAAPTDWPMHLLISRPVASAISAAGGLQVKFTDFVQWLQSRGFILGSVKVGGAVLDLEKERDLLGVLKRIANLSGNSGDFTVKAQANNHIKGSTIDSSARLFGRVLCGNQIRIGADAVVSGPVMLGSGVNIGAGAVVRNSVIAPGLTVPEGAVLENRLIENERQLFESRPKVSSEIVHGLKLSQLLSSDTYGHHRFKTWQPFSYARFWKRLFDVIVALAVLILFLPVAPFVALAIKFTSPGPVFFRDRRQGLHGRHFYCLKFRTMISDASRLQEHLRRLNQVEGPQFSIKDDPRTNVVGRFLRETFIDEIPQFINVLLGQMSLIGPRPSPESENTQCPRWRDARLSVKPGITGLWQVCRTRAWGRDFQEWIKYDMMYVRKLSLKMDLWICWRTVTKILMGFVKQLKK